MIKIKDSAFCLVTHPDCPDVLFVRSDFWGSDDRELYDTVNGL